MQIIRSKSVCIFPALCVVVILLISCNVPSDLSKDINTEEITEISEASEASETSSRTNSLIHGTDSYRDPSISASNIISNSSSQISSESENISQTEHGEPDSFGDAEVENYFPSVKPTMAGSLNINMDRVINRNIIGGGVNFSFSDYVYYDFTSSSGFNLHVPHGFGIKDIEDPMWENYFKAMEFTGMEYVRFQVNYLQWEPVNDNNDPNSTDFIAGYVFSPDFKKRSDTAAVPENTYIYMEKMYRLLDFFEEKGMYVVLGNWNFESSGSLGFAPGRTNWLSYGDPNFYDEFAESFAALMYHLKVEKGYKCVKGFSVFNEPENISNYVSTLTTVYEKCAEHLERLGIRDKVLIQAYDGPILWSKENGFGTATLNNMLSDIGEHMDILSLHHYVSTIDAGPVGGNIQGTISSRLIKDFVKPIIELAGQKPLILSELGTFAYADPNDIERSAKTIKLPLFNAEAVTAILNAGVKGYGLWNYNCHLHEHFSMLKPKIDDLSVLIPDDVNFYPSSLIIKYFLSGTDIVESSVSGFTINGQQRVFATVGCMDDESTILLVNDSDEPARMRIRGADGSKPYRMHYVCSGKTDRIYPGGEMQISDGTVIFLRPQSITVITTHTFGSQTVR